MARPHKNSMQYFSHDTDARSDRKIKLFLAGTGLTGYGFLWAIYEDIYNHSYYTPWTEEDQTLFAAQFSCQFSPISYQDISLLIQEACKWELFDPIMLEMEQILTSSSIQRRYLKQSARHKLIELNVDYLLIDINEFYENELSTAPVSIRLRARNGETVKILGDYKNGAGKDQPAPADPNRLSTAPSGRRWFAKPPRRPWTSTSRSV
jgi:hypothetical protein